MNIGIDIDGVILDTESWFRAYSEIFDIENGGNGVVRPDDVIFQNRMDWTEEDFNKFKEKYGYFIEGNASLMPCVQTVLTKLKEMRHNLIVITARGYWSQKEIDIAKETFKKHNLQFDKVFFDAKDKAEICIKEKIDYMIDDSYSNVDKISSAGIPCLYFRDVWQKKMDKPNVKEVSSWGEIYRFFYDLNK